MQYLLIYNYNVLNGLFTTYLYTNINYVNKYIMFSIDKKMKL